MYWDTIEDINGNALVVFARMVFSLVPHAADCERLFSVLGQNDQKSRNQLSPNMLRIIGQLKTYIRRNKNRVIRFVDPTVGDDVARLRIPTVEGDIREAMERQLEELGFDVVDPEELMQEMEANDEGDDMPTEVIIADQEFDLSNKFLDEVTECEDLDFVDPLIALREGYTDYDPVDLAKSLNVS